LRFGFLVTALVCLSSPALAQTSLTLAAAPVPIIEAQINDRPVRLEVDLRMPDMLTLSSQAAERMRVRRLPFANVQVNVDGGGAIRGRIARPRIEFGDRASRAFAGVFPTPMSAYAEGVIGPGALPYDLITITLGAAPVQTRDMTFTLEDADVWRVRAEMGGETLNVTFDVSNRDSIFNRTAARVFDRTGLITASGELAERALILGLRTQMQPVTTELAFSGLLLGPVYARTGAPLLGALEEDAIVIEAEGDAPPASLTVGRAALERAGCASISVDRRTRRLTLRCAG
jgi:hypothetical protein